MEILKVFLNIQFTFYVKQSLNFEVRLSDRSIKIKVWLKYNSNTICNLKIIYLKLSTYV